MDFRRSQKPPERQQQTPPQRTVTNLSPSTPMYHASEQPRRIPKYALAALALAGMLIIGAVAWHVLNRPAGPRSDRYQVVFLDDNQVFFGKLKNTHGNYLRLENVYSTQSDPSSNEDSQSVSGDISLVKVGNLVYGPEDTMMIRADKVKFWQDLKSDSKISKTIDAQQ